MITEPAGWAILFLPLASFAVVGLLVRPFAGPSSRLGGYVTILAVAGSFALSIWALASVAGREEALPWEAHRWLALGAGRALDFGVGIYMDSLTGIMLVVVSGVSLLIQVYSLGYMRGDPGYSRYFALMSLFTASMLGLVMARNIIQLYVFWELVGVCSYLLIGFWYHRPSAAAAAKKAFIVTRIGDFGFLVAILYLFFQRPHFVEAGLNVLEIPDLQRAAVTGVLGAGALAWIAGGVFAGAIGKSGQVPLHVWLPDAMEGPTPVSALIHAATMVAAGVFLVARLFPLFQPDPVAHGMTAPMVLVALVGGITALFAASMGLVMHDIKRVLAYSTISQLGFMMLALGVGAYDAAIFHLFTHAFFKALLFLGAGSVNHATGTFDMRYMGGLRRAMPWTYASFLVASLSLAGFPFFAGWWSKDEILAHAFGQGALGQAVYGLGIAAAFMTAFYIFRALHLTFHGAFRGGVERKAREAAGAGAGPAGPVVLTADEEEKAGEPVHLGESPAVMVVPMLLLAVPAAVAGFLANPPVSLGAIPGHWFAGALVPPGEALAGLEAEVAGVDWGLAAVGSVVALAGIGLSYVVYLTRRLPSGRVAQASGPLYPALYRKYYVDEVYEKGITARLFYRAVAGLVELVDARVVDGVVNGVGWLGRNTGRAVAILQTGQVQAYGIGISTGIVALVAGFLIWG